MIANILAILLGLACVALVLYEIRRAYRRGYEAGREWARHTVATAIEAHAARATEDDFRGGVYAGALDVYDRIAGLRVEGKP